MNPENRSCAGCKNARNHKDRLENCIGGALSRTMCASGNLNIEEMKLPELNPKKPMVAEVLARQVKKRRHSAELTQEDVAVRCGIYRTYLSRIEHGTANPSISVLEALAVVLKVTVADLVQESLD